jgi:two-component system phosphate regulon sensor histidine kinase PhoR
MANDKQITLVPELSELYLPVHVDRDLFGQGVINLLSNAIKYTPERGEVRLRSRMEGDEAVIEVRDNGMGIPADSLPRLFQRFYRVPENNKAAAGTGLGLALVQYIVADVHNGRVTVTSKVNEGSCFSIHIPLGHRKSAKRKPEPAACPV